MARRCERPDCAQIAEVAYRFDATRRLVVLDALDPERDARAGGLCRRHADSLVLPRGWWLDDQRLDTPPLFDAPPPSLPDDAGAPAAVDEVTAAPPAPKPKRTRKPKVRVVEPEPEPTAAAEPEPVAEPVVDVAPEPRPVEPESSLEPEPGPGSWRPDFHTTDDLEDLHAESPLLSRAFGRHRAAGGSGA